MSDRTPLYINLGCGGIAPPNWINCDSSWNAQLERFPIVKRALRAAHLASGADWPKNVRYMQLRNKFPWKTDTAEVIYASHVLEHLGDRVRDNFLAEAYRVLKQNGVLRLVVPDLYYHAKKYVDKGTEKGDTAEEFLHSIHLRMPDRDNWFRGIYYWAAGYPHVHKDMYDRSKLESLVAGHGFQSVGCFSYGNSPNIPNIKDVECYEHGYEGSIYLEARKVPRGAG